MSSLRIPLIHVAQLRLIPSTRVSSVEDLVIIEVCAVRNATCFSRPFLKNVSFEPKNNICCNMLSQIRDNVDIKYYICFLRIPKTSCLYVLVGENGAGTALMDTGSSGSFISLGYVRKHRLQMKPSAGNVSIASSSLKASIKGQCTVDLNLQEEWYPDVKLSVLPHLCSDIILGQDFTSQHSTISFAFGGSKKDLVISHPISSSVPSALVDTPSLISNIDPACKPITTKSKRE